MINFLIFQSTRIRNRKGRKRKWNIRVQSYRNRWRREVSVLRNSWRGKTDTSRLRVGFNGEKKKLQKEREREEKLYGLEEKDNIVMFTDQICQKKKKVKKEKKEEAHWLRPNISEYTINNKHYVKFTRGFFLHFSLCI